MRPLVFQGHSHSQIFVDVIVLNIFILLSVVITIESSVILVVVQVSTMMMAIRNQRGGRPRELIVETTAM